MHRLHELLDANFSTQAGVEKPKYLVAFASSEFFGDKSNTPGYNRGRRRVEGGLSRGRNQIHLRW